MKFENFFILALLIDIGPYPKLAKLVHLVLKKNLQTGILPLNKGFLIKTVRPGFFILPT